MSVSHGPPSFCARILASLFLLPSSRSAVKAASYVRPVLICERHNLIQLKPSPPSTLCSEQLETSHLAPASRVTALQTIHDTVNVDQRQMTEYLLRLAQVHETFRKPELQALASLHGFGDLDVSYYEEGKPYCILRLPSDDAAKTLISRSVFCQSAHELWGAANDYNALRQDARHRTTTRQLERYRRCSFRFNFDSFQGKRTSSEQRDIVESFSFLGFDGPIRMNNPELQVTVFECFELNASSPSMLYLGRWVADGNRNAVLDFDLKKRRYIGLTSMDAELSLVTANMAHAAQGRIIYDPFVGTGSFSIAAAYYGSAVLGSDIDGRTIRGTRSCNHLSNYAQYTLLPRFLDNFIADLTHTPLRAGPWLDSIVCDPPYGVREGPRVLGYREEEKDTTPVLIDGVLAHM